MGETLKELGKFLYNFALLIGGAEIVKPFIEGKGTCANCLVNLIMEKGYVVCNPFKPNPPKPKLKPKLKRRKP
jgi:hypothetical protein